MNVVDTCVIFVGSYLDTNGLYKCLGEIKEEIFGVVVSFGLIHPFYITDINKPVYLQTPCRVATNSVLVNFASLVDRIRFLIKYLLY